MKDPRISQLAKNLINYSVSIKPGENLLIELFDSGDELASELIRECYRAGANPFLSIKSRKLMKDLIMNTSKEHMLALSSFEADRMKKMHAYIAIRGALNSSELSDIPEDKMSIYMKNWSKPVHSDIRVPHTKWCVMRYPSHAMAQMAGMSMERFEDFFFDVCCLDYSNMDKAMNPLKELMDKTDKVKIRGKDTDLSFSIKNLPAIKCSGEANIPDGE
ncbi:MAG TPA: aminopeptidase, partial [Clostridiaceae bacterium]|nr:aminopeptidase [Clostridiaceae bacterium]